MNVRNHYIQIHTTLFGCYIFLTLLHIYQHSANSVIAVFLLLHYLIISLHVQLVNLCIHIITTGKCASQGFTVDNMWIHYNLLISPFPNMDTYYTVVFSWACITYVMHVRITVIVHVYWTFDTNHDPPLEKLAYKSNAAYTDHFFKCII